MTRCNEAQIRAANAAVFGDYGALASAAPVLAPDPPRAFVAGPLERAMQLSWLPPPPDADIVVVGYEVQNRQTRGFLPFANALSVSANVTLATVFSLGNRVAYQFRIRAVAAGGVAGAWSDIIEETPSVPPSAPRDFAGVTRYQAISLNWRAPIDNGGQPVEGYILRHWPAAQPAQQQTISLNSPTPAYQLENLVNNLPYAFALRATTRVGMGPEAAVITVSPNPTPPGPPSDVQISLYPPSVVVSIYSRGRWLENITVNSVEGGTYFVTFQEPDYTGGSDIVDYFISYRTRTGNFSTWTFWGNHHARFPRLIYAPNGITVRLYARNALGDSNPPAVATYIAPNAPQAPRGLSVAAGNARAVFGWQPPPDSLDVTAYVVNYRSLADGFNLLGDSNCGNGVGRPRFLPLFAGYRFDQRRRIRVLCSRPKPAGRRPAARRR